MYLIAPAHTLFAYWAPSFLEDFIDFNRAALIGVAIFMLMIAALMTQSSETIEFFVTLLTTTLYLFVYAPCAHAAIIIKTKVSTVNYEQRTLNRT